MDATAIGNTCGNGSIEAGETCDGSNLNGASCTSLGFTSGALGCAASCRFDTSGCVGALSLTVTPSRTTCAAPCGVFFDATTTTGLQNGDYVGANFSWDFDSTKVDPTGIHEQTVGFVTAHVFDNPGTYQVSVGVRDLAGHAGSTTVTITVSAMTGPTIYVAANGNDKNAGTMALPMATLAAALKANSAAQTSILLRRGDTFKVTSELVVGASGPFLIGAYGAVGTAAPILSSTAGTVGSITSPDIRLVDLHVVSTAAATIGLNASSPHALIERVEIEGIGSTSTNGANTFSINPTAKPVFIVDCHAHSFQGYGLYGTSPNQLAIIGTTMDNFGGGEHGVRLQGGTDNGTTTGQYANSSYMAESVVTSNDTNTAVSAVQFRGNNQNVVFVGNTVNREVGIQPQNDSSLEHVSFVLAEGNLVNDPRPNTYYVPFTVKANHVVVRNNIFVNAVLAVAVQSHPLLPVGYVDDISVYNNTGYAYPPAGGDMTDQVYLVGHHGTTGSLIVENNVLATAVTSPNTAILSSDHMGSDTEDHNLVFAPNVKGSLSNPGSGTGDLVADPQFASTDVTTASPFQLSAGSPAVDSGTAVPVYQDRLLSARPSGSGWDLGAYELVSSAAAPQGGAAAAAGEVHGIASRKTPAKPAASR